MNKKQRDERLIETCLGLRDVTLEPGGVARVYQEAFEEKIIEKASRTDLLERMLQWTHTKSP